MIAEILSKQLAGVVTDMKTFGNRSARVAKLASAVAALAVFAGCSTLGPQTPEQQVEKRAAAYWKARASADPKAAYALLAPAYRDIKTEKDFVSQFNAGANLRDTGVSKVTCEEPGRCIARISLTAKPMVPGLNLPLITTYLDDVWVFEQGQWWRFETP